MNEGITPKGPRKIPTGGRGSINNPAYDQGAYYEGDPAGFDFKAQRKNHESLKAALARAGKKLEYIAVARSPSGPDTFVATAPGVVWQKYVPNDPQGAQNNIYIRGVKIKFSSFFALEPDQQDKVLSGNMAEAVLYMNGDLFKYMELLSTESPEAIKASLEENKKNLLDMIVNTLKYGTKGIGAMRDIKKCSDMLSAKGVEVPWLTVPAFIKLVKRHYQERVRNELLAWPRSAFDTAKKCRENGIDIDAMRMLTSKKHDIIKSILSSIKDNGGRASITVQSNVGYLQSLVDWPELAIIQRSISSM